MLPWNERYCKSFVEFQKPKDANMIHNETTVQIKSAPQKTKKTVFPETAEKSTGPLKTLTKLLLCVILQTVKDN